MGWDPFRKTLPAILRVYEQNSDKVYRIRKIREHLVDLERIEQIYLVTREQENSWIHNY